MTDIDLTELQPLAQVIADKLHSVPVRLGRHGDEDLINELTIAVAAYIGRDVLPAEWRALFAQPPYPDTTSWDVQLRVKDDQWHTLSRGYTSRDEAIKRRAEAAESFTDREVRVVRAATTFSVEEP